MINRITNFIIYIYLLIEPNRKSDSLIILINEQNPQRIDIFKKFFNALKFNGRHDFKIIFTKNRIDYLAKSKSASIIFTYGISKHINTDNLMLMYLGQVGIENVKQAKYKIYNPPNFASNMISDYVISSVFSYERGLLQNLWQRNNYKWHQKGYTSLKSKSLRDIKIGIIGIGDIGKKCANSFRNFGCEVHGYDINNEVINYVDYFYTGDEIYQMLPKVDYLILTLNNEGNDNFLDKSKIALLTNNCCVVNVSRSKILDEEFLLYSIKNKKLRGAILDVFSKEPLPKRNRLWKTQGIIITPHIAGNIEYVFEEIVEDFYFKIEKEIINV